MRNASNFKSSFGEGYKFLVYDEFIDDNGRKICDVGLMSFLSLVVSIKRNTPNFKCYMFSNLNSDRTLLLNDLNIDKHAPIQYKTAKVKKIVCNILYLNLLSKFSSLTSDPTYLLAAQLNDKIAKAWLNNSTIKSSDRIINSDYSKLYKPIISFTDGVYLWTLSKYTNYFEKLNRNITTYLLSDTFFLIAPSNLKTLTCDINTHNLYNTVYLDPKRFKRWIHYLQRIAKNKLLYLTSSKTFSLFLDSFLKFTK